jgi:lipopolysaccharide biosynthesis protein
MTVTDPVSPGVTAPGSPGEHWPRSGRPRFLGFYLPQFHPIPENDEWWGPGFTEWTNVTRARPRFRGHEQPHRPRELGYYDLRLPEVRAAQAALAASHGIDGFVYYHYWFEGRRLLERPFADVLARGEPSLPFCLCWANEPWTRIWDGGSRQILVPQGSSPADDLAHIQSLLPALGDPRYVRVDGRPLLIVYRASTLTEPRRTAEVWRTEVSRAGLGELLLARVESNRSEHAPPGKLGFDLAVEFQPDFSILRPPMARTAIRRGANGLGIPVQPPKITRFEYPAVVDRMLAKPAAAYPRAPGVTPMWDNTARRERGAVALVGSTPAEYGRWLRGAAAKADHGLVFINAWNEWAEGSHLEPCERWGLGYLEEHRRVVAELERERPRSVAHR